MTPLSLLLIFSIFVLLPSPSVGDAIYGPSCNLSTTPTSIYPCKSYAFYRANSTDLCSVADLFNTNRISIANASNISDTSQSLYPNQPLLIPLECSCFNKNHSYALVNYQFISGNTFWIIAHSNYANLTTSEASVLANPTMIPVSISVGAWAKIPIFCQCPTTNLSRNYSAIISYSVQPGDTLASIAEGFGMDVSSLTEVNDGVQTDPAPFTVIYVPINSSLPIDLSSFEPENRSAPAPTAENTDSSDNNDGSDNDGAVIGLGIVVGVLGCLLICLVFVFCFFLRRKKKSAEDKQIPIVDNRKDNGDTSLNLHSTANYDGLLSGIDDCLDKYRVFHISDLRKATKDFDSKYLISGNVYKGWLDGRAFAIKMMKWNAGEELRILQKVNHTNLVKLEGFSINREDGGCYMVYEYVENGSLLECMKSPTTKLDWRRRVNIGIDVANGLQYIHEHTFPTVVHKDITSSNILLDNNFKAKIANFGLARSGCNAMTTNIVGTQGYVSPEYLVEGLVTTKMDVYAFGVLLLELISGREAVSEEGVLLSAEVDMVEFEGDDAVGIEKLRSWMDPRIRSEIDRLGMESVVMLIGIAKGCLQKDSGRRSGMTEVVYALSKVDDILSVASTAGN
ncbi:hypothetical protein ZOSMA_88G00710 [Zostera marina]|uniref:Uncharacterized protein n=1 Tax=Zostera marina TaxID=29655 RepID=A0A0K9NKF9_ZOSMR|nr:hypothetical protein ZOSMA_88G00710 [Zostera marina]